MKRCKIIILLCILPFFILIGCSKSHMLKLKDLEQKTIGISVGTVENEMMNRIFPDSNIRYYENENQALEELKNDKIDALVSHLQSLKKIAASDKQLRILDELIYEEDYVFAVKRGNKRLENEVNNIIMEFIKSGVRDSLIERWFPEEGEAGPMPNFLPMGSKGVLKVGTCASVPPFSYVGADGHIEGLDIELAMRIARRLDMRLDIVNMDFKSLISELNSGKVDMIAAGITASNESGKSVDFLVPYFNSGVGVIVKK